MKLRALQDTYFEAPRKKGDVFDADDVNGRVLVELIGSCEKVEDMPKQETKAETPPASFVSPPAPEAPKYEAAAMTTDNVEPLVKRRNYKRRDLRAED